MTGWLARLLIRLLPETFRQRFGDDLRDEWQTLRHQARARRGRLAEWAYMIRESGAFVRLLHELRGREAPSGSGATTVLPDVRGAWRLVTRRPVVTIAMVVTLMLAFTAAGVAYGVGRGILWRALPFPDESRLVFVWERVTTDGAPQPARVTGSRFVDWSRRSSSLASLSAFGAASFQVDGAEGVATVRGVRVSANFLDTLGVVPALGRAFTPADQLPGAPKTVVLSHAFWTRRLGGRADVLGQPLRMSGVTHTIIGVLPDIWMPAWPVNPAGVTLDPDSRQVWVTLPPEATLAQNTRAHVLGVVARLREAKTAVMAEGELATAEPGSPDPHGAFLRPLRSQVTGQARGALITLIGAALCVWLVACMNLAALQLGVFESRRPEFSTRFALGAAPWRLTRQLWIESAMVVTTAAAAALLLAHAVFTFLPARLSAQIPFVTAPSVDTSVLVLVTGLAALTVTILTLWPTRRVHRLRGLEHQRTVSANPPVFRGLVVVQLSGTVALVVVSALLLRSFWALQARDLGFEVRDVTAIDLSLPADRFGNPESVVAFEAALQEQLSALPWVGGSALAYDLPLEANWLDLTAVVGGPQGGDDEVRLQTQLRIVSPSYFQVLGVRVVEGRAFQEHDGLGQDGIVLVNEAFMRRTPLTLGRRLRVSAPRFTWGDKAPDTFAIAGVVEDERFRGIESDVEPAVYVSTRQFPQTGASLLVRVPPAREDAGADLRAIVRRVEPRVSLGAVTTLEAVEADQRLARTLTTNLVGGFAGLSLLLASVGLHGLLTLIVTGRRREIGVRLALGAPRSTVAGSVIRESLHPVGIGVVSGLLLSQLASITVRALLVDVTPLDPLALTLVTTFMVVVGVVAAVLPARQATRVDPATTLRS